MPRMSSWPTSSARATTTSSPRCKADLAAKSIDISEHMLEKQLQECREIAAQQIKANERRRRRRGAGRVRHRRRTTPALAPEEVGDRRPGPGRARPTQPRGAGDRRPARARSRPATAIGRRAAGAPTSDRRGSAEPGTPAGMARPARQRRGGAAAALTPPGRPSVAALGHPAPGGADRHLGAQLADDEARAAGGAALGLPLALPRRRRRLAAGADPRERWRGAHSGRAPGTACAGRAVQHHRLAPAVGLRAAPHRLRARRDHRLHHAAVGVADQRRRARRPADPAPGPGAAARHGRAGDADRQRPRRGRRGSGGRPADGGRRARAGRSARC